LAVTEKSPAPMAAVVSRRESKGLESFRNTKYRHTARNKDTASAVSRYSTMRLRNSTSRDSTFLAMMI